MTISLKSLILLSILLVIFLSPVGSDPLNAGIVETQELIADTLHIPLEFSGESSPVRSGVQVVDLRRYGPRVLDIHQTSRYLIIPVDQFLIVPDSLKNIFQRFLQMPASVNRGSLQINHLDLWHDSDPLFAPGWMLNAETRLIDSSGNLVSLWQWELKRNAGRKEDLPRTVTALMQRLLVEQQTALSAGKYYNPAIIRPYRRTLNLWFDTILYSEGYAVDARLSLYYPADQQESYLRGIRGVYYRNSPERQSIALGGNDLQWFHRLTDTWLARLNGTFRIGFNQFNPNRYDYVDWYNLFLVNIGFAQTVEWRPRYFKGFYAGLGLHQSVNLLPDIVPRFEPGVLLTLGVRLP